MVVSHPDFDLIDAQNGNTAATRRLWEALAQELRMRGDARSDFLADRLEAVAKVDQYSLSTHKANSEIVGALGLRRKSGGQKSDYFDEWIIYESIRERMAECNMGYKAAVEKMFKDSAPCLQLAPNTDRENIYRIYRRFRRRNRT